MVLYILFLLSITSINITCSQPPLKPDERKTVQLIQTMLLLDHKFQQQNPKKGSRTIANAMKYRVIKDPQRFIEVLRWYNFPHLRTYNPETYDTLQKERYQSKTNNKTWKSIISQLTTMSEPSPNLPETDTPLLTKKSTVAHFAARDLRFQKAPEHKDQPKTRNNLNGSNYPTKRKFFGIQDDFICAIKNNNIVECQKCINLGAQLDKQSMEGSLPLQTAIAAAHPGIVRFLIEQGATITPHFANCPTYMLDILHTQKPSPERDNMLERQSAIKAYVEEQYRLRNTTPL